MCVCCFTLAHTDLWVVRRTAADALGTVCQRGNTFALGLVKQVWPSMYLVHRAVECLKLLKQYLPFFNRDDAQMLSVEHHEHDPAIPLWTNIAPDWCTFRLPHMNFKAQSARIVQTTQQLQALVTNMNLKCWISVTLKQRIYKCFLHKFATLNLEFICLYVHISNWIQQTSTSIHAHTLHSCTHPAFMHVRHVVHLTMHVNSIWPAWSHPSGTLLCVLCHTYRHFRFVFTLFLRCSILSRSQFLGCLGYKIHSKNVFEFVCVIIRLYAASAFLTHLIVCVFSVFCFLLFYEHLDISTWSKSDVILHDLKVMSYFIIQKWCHTSWSESDVILHTCIIAKAGTQKNEGKSKPILQNEGEMHTSFFAQFVCPKSLICLPSPSFATYFHGYIRMRDACM